MRGLVLFATLLCAGRAFGYGAGVFGYSGKPPAQSCNDCHSGGTAPAVTLSGPTSLPAGGSGTYALDIVTGASTSRVGFDVATSDGTIGKVVQTNESWINSGELSHTKTWPKGDMVRVQFTLTAPMSGPVTLYATGLSSDGVDDTGGDTAASTTWNVDVVTDPSADLAPAVEDLAGVDAVSGASPPPTIAPDLGPPHDEPRWACACDLGHAPARPGVAMCLLAFAIVGLRYHRRGGRR
jgi:hypothetical protein